MVALKRVRSPTLVGEDLLDRLGLAGLLVLSAGLVVGDFLSAGKPAYALAFTAAETALVFPWAGATARLSREDLNPRNARRWPVSALRAAHAVNVLLLALCLYQKWSLVLDVQRGQLGNVHIYRIFTVAAYVVVNVGLLGRGSRVGRLLIGLSDSPARLTMLSFGLFSLLGALLLTLPMSLREPSHVSFVDGLFTAVSAVCVTGLVVHGTPETYTGFGQAVILVLIQVGGLGIMSMYAAFAVLAGRRLRVRSTAVLAEMVDARSLSELKRSVRTIVLYALALEALGGLILYGLFASYPETQLGIQAPAPLAGAGSRAWAAIFHSVSAFCNAGFTVFRAGVMPFADDHAVCLTLMVLITLGGLGFPVLTALLDQLRARIRRKRPLRLSLHARTVLLTSTLLAMLGCGAFLALESNGVLAGRTWPTRILMAMFQSVTTRTAGFNTLPIAELSAASLMITCGLMFIGASPGSTGGGVKTTTLAVLFATFRAELLGRDDPRMFDRRLAPATTRRAVGVFFLSIVLFSVMLFALLISEEHDTVALGFEALSAFATVGLSTGITPALSPVGKLIITLTMFIGRIGPMTLALALAERRGSHGPRLAEEAVIIG